MMLGTIALPNVLFRVLVKRPLASGGTEVIRLPLVFRRAACDIWINFHYPCEVTLQGEIVRGLRLLSVLAGQAPCGR